MNFIPLVLKVESSSLKYWLTAGSIQYRRSASLLKHIRMDPIDQLTAPKTKAGSRAIDHIVGV